MPSSSTDALKFLHAACVFEASLIIVALLLGWLANIDPFAQLVLSETAVLYGVLGTLPLLLLFLALQAAPLEALQAIRRLLQQLMIRRLIGLHWTDLLMLAAIAGIAEEVLFRGVIQPWLERAWGLPVGLWLCALLFGLVHFITPLYCVFAIFMSVYLSLSLDYGINRNLLTPIVIHGLYDFVALLLLIRSAPKTPSNLN